MQRPDRGRPRRRRRVRPARDRPTRCPVRLGQRRPQLQQMHPLDPGNPRPQHRVGPGEPRQPPPALLRASIRVRSSVKWTALIGVTPGTIGSSVNGTRIAATVTLNAWTALRPPGSVAVTRIVAVPSLTAVSVKRAPAGHHRCHARRRRRHRVAQRIAVGVDERLRHVNVQRAVQGQSPVRQGACRRGRPVGLWRSIPPQRHDRAGGVEHRRRIGRPRDGGLAAPRIGDAQRVAAVLLARIRETGHAAAAEAGIVTLGCRRPLSWTSNSTAPHPPRTRAGSRSHTRDAPLPHLRCGALGSGRARAPGCAPTRA